MNPLLYMSLRSPFARRIRLLLEELGIDYDTSVVDVFNLPPGYHDVNPLGRVPALALPMGQTLIDSWAIVDYYKSRHASHPLFCTGEAEPRALRLSGLAVGVMEHTVAAYLETMLRAPGLRAPELWQENVDVVTRTLGVLERESAAQATPFALGSELRQCDLDLGAALAYAELRLGASILKPYPSLSAYLARLNARESFRKTVPPA